MIWSNFKSFIAGDGWHTLSLLNFLDDTPWILRKLHGSTHPGLSLRSWPNMERVHRSLSGFSVDLLRRSNGLWGGNWSQTVPDITWSKWDIHTHWISIMWLMKSTMGYTLWLAISWGRTAACWMSRRTEVRSSYPALQDHCPWRVTGFCPKMALSCP